jgi:hypothetical protein
VILLDSPVACCCLAQSVCLNGFEDRYVILKGAVGDTEKTVSIFTPDVSVGINC